jgi:hypothetical protein
MIYINVSNSKSFCCSYINNRTYTTSLIYSAHYYNAYGDYYICSGSCDVIYSVSHAFNYYNQNLYINNISYTNMKVFSRIQFKRDREKLIKDILE